jgi:hypothetical protein
MEDWGRIPPDCGGTAGWKRVHQNGAAKLQDAVGHSRIEWGTSGVQYNRMEEGTTGVQYNRIEEGTTGVQYYRMEEGTTGVRYNSMEEGTTGAEVGDRSGEIVESM